MARKRTARLVPWMLESHSRDETARCLLLQTGSVQAAHDAITRNADILKKPKRDVDDTILLLTAVAIQRRDGCKQHTALRAVARLRIRDADVNPDTVDTLIKRLQRTLKGKTLEEFAESYPPWAVSLPELR